MTAHDHLILARLEHLAKVYERAGVRQTVLADISLDIRPRGHVALRGRSGSGKSTLLHILAGLESPSSGSVRWPAFNGPLRPVHVGIMFQSQSLIPWLSTLENVALPLMLCNEGLSATDEAMAALDRFGIGELAHKLPQELSGGQAQRASLVRATVTRPALLLADEPTGQLDRATGDQLMETLTAWAERNDAALVVATHDARVADRFPTVIRLESGRILVDSERSLS